MSHVVKIAVILWCLVARLEATDIFRLDAATAECAPSSGLAQRLPDRAALLQPATRIGDNQVTFCDTADGVSRGILTRGTPSGGMTGMRSSFAHVNLTRLRQFTIAWEGTINNCFVPSGYSNLTRLGPAVPNEGRVSLFLANGCLPRLLIGAGPAVSTSSAGSNQPLPTDKRIRLEGSYVKGELRLFVTIDGQTELRSFSRTPLELAQVFERPASEMFLSVNAYANGLDGCNCTTFATWMTDEPVLYGSPSITSVFNGATFVENASAPGSAIGRDSWVTIRGTSLSTRTTDWTGLYVPGGPMPTELGGTRVRLAGKELPISYVSPGQINFYVPKDAPVGASTLQVRTAAGWADVPITIQDIGTGLFSYTGVDGKQHVAAQNADYSTVGKDIPGTRPADSGSVVLVYGTGCGPAVESSTSPGLFQLSNSVRVEIAGQAAEVLFAGYSGPGLCQVNVRVPEVATNTYPIKLQVGPTASQELSIAVMSRN